MDVVVPIIFPAYRITVVERPVEIDIIPFVDFDNVTIPRTRVADLGHAGVLLIRGRDGLTKYYEYGRYDVASLGIVRRVSVPNARIGRDGKPTTASLAHLFAHISRRSGQNGRVAGVYIEREAAFDRMNRLAQDRLADNADPGRESYSLVTNSCLHFAIDVAEAGGADLPVPLDPRPSGYLVALRQRFRSIDYDPRTRDLTLEPERTPMRGPRYMGMGAVMGEDGIVRQGAGPKY